MPFPLTFLADIMCPLGYGLIEITEGHLKDLVKKILAHFEKNNIVQSAIQSAFIQGLETLQIAISGHKFYHRAAIKDFGKKFQQEILLPFLQQRKAGEDFIKKCQQEIIKLKEFNIAQDIPQQELANSIMLCITNKLEVHHQMSTSADKDFIKWLKAFYKTDSSALVELLEYRNVLKDAMQLHFGMAIQKDEELFRAFWLTNQQGVQYQLETLNDAIQTVKEQRNGEIFNELQGHKALLQKIQSQAEFGLNYIHPDIIKMFDQQFQNSLCWYKSIIENFQILQSLLREELQNIQFSIGEVRKDLLDTQSHIKDELTSIKTTVQKIAAQSLGTTYIHQEINCSVLQTSSPNQATRNSPYLIVIVGQAKRGKSALINAILGKTLLPTCYLNTLSVTTHVKYGANLQTKLYLSEYVSHFSNLPAKVYEHFQKNIPLALSLDEIETPSLFYNDDNSPISPYQRLEIEYPHLILSHGIEFVELPAYDDNSLETYLRTPKVSYILASACEIWQILSFSHFLTPSDKNFIQFLQNIHPGITIRHIVNFIDQVPNNERASILKFCQSKLHEPYLISATQGFDAKLNDDTKLLVFSGIAQLEETLSKNFLISSRR